MFHRFYHLVRTAPSWRLSMALIAALAFAMLMMSIASSQTRHGVKFRAAGDRLTVSGEPVRKAAGVSSAEVTGIRSGGTGPLLPLKARAITEEPNSLPTYAEIRQFYAKQSQIAAIMRDKPIVTLRSGERELDMPLSPIPRPRLPFAFWYQSFVGLAVFGIAAWLWAISPGNRANLLFAISGAAMLMSAGSAAVYSSRELALDGDLFRLLALMNEAGASLFGIAMSHLFLTFPRRLINGRQALLLWLGLGTWTVLGMMQQAVSPAWGGNGTTLCEMVIIALAIGAQYIATRGDPVGRASLRWFGIGTLLGAGGFITTATVPLVFGHQMLVDQATAFGFFLIIVIGIALGLRRDRLFALDRISYGILYYGLIAALFFLLDILLIYALGSRPWAGIASGLVLLPLLYLPVRDRIFAWIAGSRRPDVQSILEDVTGVSLALTEQERAQRWRDTLRNAFQPLHIEAADGTDSVEVAEHGAAMLIPAVAGSPPLCLRLARNGTSLFSQSDRNLAERMVGMARRLHSDRIAFERGVDAERARVARDLHDDLAARLMDGLAQDDPARLREVLRGALAEVRTIVNGPRGIPTALRDVLADARVEMAERLEAANIRLDWDLHPAEGYMSPAQTKALQSTLRELTTNIIKHSGGDEARVETSVTDGGIAIMISNNSRRAPDGGHPSTGNGLNNIAHRLSSIGGCFSSGATPHGYRAELSINLGGS